MHTENPSYVDITYRCHFEGWNSLGSLFINILHHRGFGRLTKLGRKLPFLLPTSKTVEKPPQGNLVISVLRQVDEGIHGAVEEYHQDGELVVNAVPVHFISQIIHQEIHLIIDPTNYEANTDQQKGLDSVSPGQLELVGAHLESVLAVVDAVAPGVLDATVEQPDDPSVAVDEDAEREDELDADEENPEGAPERQTRPKCVQLALT